MELADLLKRAGNLDPVALLGGQKIAAMQQAISFAMGCHPAIVECDFSQLADTLGMIHSEGGLIVSVVAGGSKQFIVVAYMPKKEETDGK